MRYVHGHKPRNPYNMIIQENHAADGANSIIPYLGESCRTFPSRGSTLAGAPRDPFQVRHPPTIR